MEIIVNYNKLKNVSKRIHTNSRLIDEQLDRLSVLIENSKSNWQGDAADIFYNNIESYIKRLRSVPVCHRNMTSIINFMNNNYQVIDEEYADTLKKAVVKHG